MTAKERHTAKLIEYLGNPENEYLPRIKLSTAVLGLKTAQGIHNTFTAAELNEIEAQALEIRRKKYAAHLARVDDAVLKAAMNGDIAAAKLAYMRFEGWSEKTIRENTGADGKSLYPEKFTITLVRPGGKVDAQAEETQVSVADPEKIDTEHACLPVYPGIGARPV